MEERDYLKEMFECYFRYRKMNSELPMDRLFDAISGALSGVDYPKIVRSELLKNLIYDIDIVKKATERALSVREQLTDSKTIIAEVTIAEKAKLSSSDWMEIDEVCQVFKLSKNNIKDKTWRDNHNFPYHQASKGAKTTFNRKEVADWINANKH